MKIHRRAAFTLLEVLFATGLVVTLMAALYMSLSIALRSRDSANAAVAPVKTALQAADLVRQDLEAILPPDLWENGKLSGEFVGTTQNGSSLDFFCLGNDAGWAVAPPQGNAIAGRAAPVVTDVPWSEGSRHVQLGLQADGNSSSLVRAVTRNLLAPTVPDPEVEVLCRNVQSFTLQYYDGTTWQTEWDSTQNGNALPSAVMMTLEVLVDSRPGQPPEVYSVNRVFPLACSKPLTNAAGGGN